jgi:hypothetical protein
MSGRPTKLDDLVAKRIVDAVRLGAPWYLAAEAGGVGRSTLKQWKARGADGEEPYAAFLARLKSAEAEGAVGALRVIQKAAENGVWTASAWLLERRYPKSFGRRERSAVPTTPPIAPHIVSDDDVELLEGLAAAARSARGLADGSRSQNGKGRTNGNT